MCVCVCETVTGNVNGQPSTHIFVCDWFCRASTRPSAPHLMTSKVESTSRDLAAKSRRRASNVVTGAACDDLEDEFGRAGRGALNIVNQREIFLWATARRLTHKLQRGRASRSEHDRGRG